VGVLLLALIGAFLVTSNNNQGTNVASNPPAANGAANGAVQNTVVADAPTAAAAGSDPPRMSLETFKKLYDDPATRPPIYDVRAVESYNEGHIAGSKSLPEADVDARFAEVPKDKLVILYCQ